MDLSPAELRRFIAHTPPDLRERLERCSPLRVACRKIVVGGKSIAETEEGWLIERTRELICNAPIRIEEVVTTGTGEVYYRGMARLGGVDHAFTVPKADVERRGLLSCVSSMLLHRGAGVLQFLPQWDRQAVFIAMQMGQPRAISGVDRIGWQPDHSAFVFPRFGITRTGEVRDDMRPLITDDCVPAMRLEDPRLDLLREDLEILSASRPEVAIFWAVAAGIVHNLLAPAMHAPACGILLDGQGAEITGAAAAKALGCIEVDLPAP